MSPDESWFVVAKECGPCCCMATAQYPPSCAPAVPRLAGKLREYLLLGVVSLYKPIACRNTNNEAGNARFILLGLHGILIVWSG